MEIITTFLSDITNENYTNYLLSLPEIVQTRILKKKNEEDRKLSCIGYFCAAEIYKKQENEDCDFAFLEGGKPVFLRGGLCFSISHSKDIVITAVYNKNLGVDIEKVREINLDLIKKVCTEKEKAFILETNETAEQTERFLMVWTAKEAYFKFKSTGIGNLKSVDYFSLSENIKRIEIPGYILSVYSED